MQREEAANAPREERNPVLRVLFAVLFFIPFYFVTGALTGGVVAGFAGAHTNSYAEGQAVAGPAVTNFFNNYGPVVGGGQVLAYAVLCFLRWVPGVGKYKRMKR